MDNNTSFSDSVIAKIISKTGTVLAHTKDALLQELIAENNPPKDINEFVNGLFNRLGFNIKDAAENSKLHELVKSVISATMVFEELTKELYKEMGSINWMEEIEKIREAGGESAIKKLINDLDMNSLKEFGNSIVSVNFGDGIIAKLIQCIEQIILLCQQIKNQQLANIQLADQKLKDFIESNKMYKKFADRMLDHVLVTMMRNAQEVFAEDVNEIIDALIKQGSAFENKIKEEAKKQLGSAYNELKINEAIQQIKNLRTKIKELEAELKKEVTEQAKILLKNAKAELNRLVKEVMGYYSNIGDAFSKIYAVLDFLQIVTNETVEIAQFKTDLQLPTDIPKIDTLINEAMGFDETAKTALAKLQTAVTKLDVIKWSNLEKLVSNPVGYLTKLYPITNYDDMEKLLGKIIEMLRTFNIGIPDFSSLKAILYEFKDRIESEIEKLTGDIKDKITKLKNFINDLLKVLEKFATEVKTELITALNDFVQDKKSLIDELKQKIENEISELKAKAKIPNTDVILKQLKDFIPEELKTLYADPLVKIITQKAKGNALFDKISEADWATYIGNDVLTQYRTAFSSLETSVDNLYKDFGNRFKNIIKELKVLFEKEGANMVKNFEYIEFFKQIAEKLKNIFPNNLDLYYPKFREITIQALKEKLKGISENEIRQLVIEAFAPYWVELKALLYKNFIRPYVAAIEKAVKEWMKTDIISKVKNVVYQYVQNNIKAQFDAYKNAIFSAKEMVEEKIDEIHGVVDEYWKKGKTAMDMAQNMLSLCNDLADCDTMEDGIRFVMKLYRVIDPALLKELKGMIKLPELNFGNLSLPAYKLDMKNKFLAVPIYEYAEKDKNIAISLVVFIGEKKKGEDVETGLFILPVIRGDFNYAFDIGKNHTLKFGARGELNKNFDTSADKKAALAAELFGFFLKNEGTLIKPEPKFEFIGSDKNLELYLELLFQRKTQAGEWKIFDTKYAALTLGNYPQKIFVGYKKGGVDFGYLGKLEDMKLALKLGQLNDFFEKILKDDIVIILKELAVGYSYQDGFRFNGDYSVRIPINTKIDTSMVKFNNIILEIGSMQSGMKAIGANLLTTFTADFKGIKFTFTDLGFGLCFNYMNEDGSFGDYNISPKLNFPTGIGIAIDVGPVSGSGLINWNKDKEELLGALELKIASVGGISAMVLLNMKMPDGSKGFSFMGALSIDFTPGIPLPMGFTLTAIGGSLGLNRRMDIQQLRTAQQNGALKSALFGKDLKKDLDNVIANMGKYYPVQQNQHFIGFLTQISWGTLLTADLGLFIQFPSPFEIAVAGSIKISISEKTEGLLCINVDFLGGINFQEGLYFDATIHDSKLVGISLYGSMALRIYWGGKKKGFLISVGGFHPQFNPAEIQAYNATGMKRMGLSIGCGSLLKLTLEGYFAVTSNSLQFGASAKIKIGWDSFGLNGEFSFNALFIFKPFSFVFDISAKLSLRACGITLLSIGLSFELGGPAQWHAKGKASFWILFIKIKVSFNKTWGKKQELTNKKYVELLPMFADKFKDNTNWRVISGDLVDGLVKIIKPNGDELVIQPSDRVAFTQDVIPFDTKIERYAEEFPSDISKMTLDGIGISGDDTKYYALTKSSFAPSLTRKLTDKEQLTASSFEEKDAGFELSTEGFGVRKGEETPIEIDFNYQYQVEMEHINWTEPTAASKVPAAPVMATPEVPATPATPSTPDYTQYCYTSLTNNDASAKPKVILKSLQLDATRMQKINLVQKTARLSKVMAQQPLSRSTIRRTNTGMSRYIVELDNSMSNKNVSDLMDKLIKKS